MYVESLKDARAFMTATRAFARTKPIVAYKAGRFPESARAATSHTGALASPDAVYQAAFERAGVARVFEIGDIFACAELVGRHRTPAGPRLAIVTNAGGPGVMATDALVADPNHASVEYAVLVTDAWQNRGLGGILTDVCVDVARGWGVERVVAVTTSDNARMVAVLEERGFELTPGDEGLVDVVLELGPSGKQGLRT